MTSIDAGPYPYPLSNSELIRAHSLEQHFEGGYFAQTVSITSGLPSSTPSNSSSTTLLPQSAALEGRVQRPSGSGAQLLEGGSNEPSTDGLEQQRTDATLIYYLLTPDSYRGKMHMNLHSTFHLHHSGRALYTLIQQPTSPSNGPPTIHRVVVGPDPSRGEVTQLFVPGGWWKASEIPEEDLLLLEAPNEQDTLKDRIGCLISEVVVPGWNPDQHQFIDEDKLKAMWGDHPGWEQYIKYTKAPEGLEYPDK